MMQPLTEHIFGSWLRPVSGPHISRAILCCFNDLKGHYHETVHEIIPLYNRFGPNEGMSMLFKF
jgi:hypothetical protein